jgi:transglutaminase-like putative cysteine protease
MDFRKVLIGTIAWLLCSLVLSGQEITDLAVYKEKYSDKNAAYLKISTKLTINIGKKGLEVEEAVYEKIYYPNFKAGAFSEGDVQSSDMRKLKSISASTTYPEEGKLKTKKVSDFKTTKVMSDETFYDDIVSTTFTYPMLREGAYTELSYTYSISEPRFLTYDFVSRYYPIEDYEYTIDADKNVELDVHLLNADTLNIVYTKTEKGSRVIYSWKAKDIKGYITEDKAPEISFYLPQIVPVIKTYQLKGKEIPILRNVSDLHLWYAGLINTVDTATDASMRTLTDSVVRNCTTDMSKVKNIFSWVQSNIKYIANEYESGGYIPRKPQAIFEKRYGDCKDMATLIICMLRLAGVKSYYTWLGTRSLPYKYSEIPSSIVDNHMIATYIENGQYYFLDATDSYQPVEFPNIYIQGKEALISKGDSDYVLYTIPVADASENHITDTIDLCFAGDTLKGNGTMSFSGAYCSTLKSIIERVKDPEKRQIFFSDYLEKGNNKFALESYLPAISYNDIAVNYKFSLSNYAYKSGNDFYINMNLSKIFGDDDLLKSDRNIDYEMLFKSSYSCTYKLSIPPGYYVSHIPDAASYSNELFFYEIKYVLENNVITYSINMEVDYLYLKKPGFEAWNQMLKSLRAAYKETVVLKKS